MAATAALDKELAAAREPIPVRRDADSVSKGLDNAVDRASLVGRQLSSNSQRPSDKIQALSRCWHQGRVANHLEGRHGGVRGAHDAMLRNATAVGASDAA